MILGSPEKKILFHKLLVHYDIYLAGIETDPNKCLAAQRFRQC